MFGLQIPKELLIIKIIAAFRDRIFMLSIDDVLLIN